MHGCGSKSDARRAVLRPRLSRPRPCHEATRQQNYEVPHLSTRLSYKRHRRSYSWLLLACASLPAVVHAFVCPHLGVPRLVAELTTSGFRATHVDARSLMATSVRKTMALSFPFSRRGRRRSSNASSVALPDLRLTPPTMPAIQNRYRDSPWARFAGRSLKRSRDHDNDIVIDGACSDDPSATVADLCRSNGSRRFSFRLFREHFCALRRRLSHRAGSVLVAARQTTPTLRHSRQRIIGIVLASALSFVVLGRPAIAALVGEVMGKRGRSMMAMMPPATAGVTGGGAVMGETSVQSIAPKLAVWGLLFVTSAAFHSAEIAITTLYPWKVKEFAEEEGESSPFQALNKDITRVLTSILVATTVCTIYNAALFTNLAIQIFGSAGLAYATAALTVTTLFFGELLPKALGVNNAEIVARSTLPVIIFISWALNPVAKSFTVLSKLMLSMLGFKSSETGSVSEEELRLIVTGAKMSGGIESQEGMMIEGVLDLQDTKISEVMRPRVEVVAIEANNTMMDLYTLHQETHYSRIPVYSGEIDRISGVVLSKDLLNYVQDPGKLSTVLVADAMESTYFVPETMSVWNVLEEMRRRRIHMAIVVDEYGGTAGVVTLEDILEEVVGEIYDEKEDDEFREEEHYIIVNEDGSFTIHGMADLEDVCTSLAVQEIDEEDLKEFGTLSGYLCSQAGEIPAVGDYVLVGGYMFTVTKADERRIEEVHARVIGRVGDASGVPSQGIGLGGSDGQHDEGSLANANRTPPTPPVPGNAPR